MNPGRLLDLDLHDEFPSDLRAASVPIPTDEIDQDANGKRVTNAVLTLRETRTGPRKEIVTVETSDGWKYRMQRFNGDHALTLWRRDKPDNSGVQRRAPLPMNVKAVVEAVEADEITPAYVDEAAAEQAIGAAAASPSTTVQAEAVATDGGTWACGGCKAGWDAEHVENNPEKFGTHSCPACATDDDLEADGGQEPRTDPPTDTADAFDRFGCQLNPGDDKSEPCPNCGCEALDFWMHEGATAGRTICVSCGDPVHEWDPLDGLDRIEDDGLRADGRGGDEWDLPPEERGRATEKAARKRRAEDGHERMQRERTGVAGDPVPDAEYGDQGASMEEITGEAPPDARRGEIVVAEFRAKDPTGKPTGREEYQPGEVWAICSECGYGGIIDDNAENVNADHRNGPGRLICRECADRYNRDQPNDVDGQHQVRESVNIGGTPFPTDRLMQFAGDAIDAVGGGQVLAHGPTWLLLDLPDDVDGYDNPEFPEAILDDAHDRDLRVAGILWGFGAVRFEDTHCPTCGCSNRVENPTADGDVCASCGEVIDS